MVEHKCDKCNYIAADQAALAQHLQRKTPCDEGKYLCTHCAKPLKSKDTLRNHEKTCSGPKKTREELQLDNTILHAQMSMQADASNQQMAIASNASTLAARAVYDIMSQPHKEYDANKLVLHQPVGSENTSHLKGSSLSTWFPNLTPGIDKLVRWFWLLRGREHPENHNILLPPGDPSIALICRKGNWQSCNSDKALFEVYSSDAVALYDKMGSGSSDSAEIRNFRNEFVLHKVMAGMNAEACKSVMFKTWKQAITKDLCEMTMELYGQEVASNVDYSLQQAYLSNMQQIERMQQDVKQLQGQIEVLSQANKTIFLSGFEA